MSAVLPVLLSPLILTAAAVLLMFALVTWARGDR